MGESDDPRPRMGTFFILIGLGLLFLFLASDVSNSVDFRYFFWGALLLSAGFFIRKLTLPPSKPSTRFSGLRKLLAKKPEAAKKDEKKK
jgi:hypothetical protein